MVKYNKYAAVQCGAFVYFCGFLEFAVLRFLGYTQDLPCVCPHYIKDFGKYKASAKYYTVTTVPGNFNRVRIGNPDKPDGYIVYVDNYTVDEDGNYVWRMKGLPVPKRDETHFVDVRLIDTGKYIRDYYYFNVEASPIIRDVSYDRGNGYIYFTVTTVKGDFNRIKLSYADDTSHYIMLVDKYVETEDEMVWTFYIPEPESREISYAFDIRTGSNVYLNDYYYYDVNPVISATHEKVSGYVNFYVVTAPGIYNRVRLVSLDNLNGYLNYTNSYTVNEDGNWVWMLRVKGSDVEKVYGIDARTNAGRYVKDVYEYGIEHSIKSVQRQETDKNFIFTVVTEKGPYTRLRVGYETTIANNISVCDSFVEDGDNLVWTIKTPKFADGVTIYFDLRESGTNCFIKDPFTYVVGNDN